MKQLIKRILKESIKEKLQKRLEEDGLMETLITLSIDIKQLSEMMGESKYDILEKYGPFDDNSIDDVSEIYNISKYDLAIMLDLPIAENIIEPYHLYSKIVNVENLNYENCELKYYAHQGGIEWTCNWEINNKEYTTIGFATPYYDGQDETAVSMDTINDIETYDMDGSYTIFENPVRFNNVEEFKEWFKTIYLPKTHNIFEKILSRLLPKIQ